LELQIEYSGDEVVISDGPEVVDVLQLFDYASEERKTYHLINGGDMVLPGEKLSDVVHEDSTHALKDQHPIWSESGGTQMLMRYRGLTFVSTSDEKYRDVCSYLKYALEHFFADREDKTLRYEYLEVQEIQGTERDVAVHKCRDAARELRRPLFIEDTSLRLKTMNAMPGPYIKTFMRAPETLGRMVIGGDTTAVAICTMAFTLGHGWPVRLFQGYVVGDIVAPRGQGYGYDPYFQPRCQHSVRLGDWPLDRPPQTFAEMTPARRRQWSPRRIASAHLLRYLRTQFLLPPEEPDDPVYRSRHSI